MFFFFVCIAILITNIEIDVGNIQSKSGWCGCNIMPSQKLKHCSNYASVNP